MTNRMQGTWYYLYSGCKYGPFDTKGSAASDLSERFNVPRMYASKFAYSTVDVRLLEMDVERIKASHNVEDVVEPKSEGYHAQMSDIWDIREGK
jgi:hypothetical protein